MLRRASSLLSACRLLRQPFTPAARRHPGPRLCPPPASVLGARGYVVRRMARRIPPARPDGYSTSDGEADGGYGDVDQHMEPPADADAEEGDDELEGYELDFGALFDGDKAEEEEEEGEKK